MLLGNIKTSARSKFAKQRVPDVPVTYYHCTIRISFYPHGVQVHVVSQAAVGLQVGLQLQQHPSYSQSFHVLNKIRRQFVHISMSSAMKCRRKTKCLQSKSCIKSLQHPV